MKTVLPTVLIYVCMYVLYIHPKKTYLPFYTQLNFRIFHHKETLQQGSPLDDQTTNQECMHKHTTTVSLQERHNKSKTQKYHDVQVLESWKIEQ